jgi:hypothetical protein
VVAMDKNKSNEAFSDFEESLILFYKEMKWILSSKRGKNFQFMMLSRTLEALLYRNSQLREKYKKQPKTN